MGRRAISFLERRSNFVEAEFLAKRDATIFGAFGGYEKGWNEVGPRYDWAASQFRESGAKKQIEYLNTASGGEFAFSVAIERDEVRVGDQDKPAPRALRVTQIFRKEKGEWKLLHRHAESAGRKESTLGGLRKMTAKRV